MKNGKFVKICGITRAQDTKLAVDAGTDAIGFIAYPPSKRFIQASEIREIIAVIPEDILKVGVFVNAEIDFIRDYIDSGINVLQLHGDESAEFADSLRVLLPENGEIWRAIRPEQIADIKINSDFPADKFLIDTFSHSAPGGTGELGNPELAKFAVANLPGPVILAGGLKPANVAELIAEIDPFGVDVSSGIESSPGIKNPTSLLKFIEEVKFNS